MQSVTGTTHVAMSQNHHGVSGFFWRWTYCSLKPGDVIRMFGGRSRSTFAVASGSAPA
jgi:hypothetical protein